MWPLRCEGRNNRLQCLHIECRMIDGGWIQKRGSGAVSDQHQQRFHILHLKT